MARGHGGWFLCVLLLSLAQESLCFIGGSVRFHRAASLPGLRGTCLKKRGLGQFAPRMQIENFGDSPADVLKWMKEREADKAEKGAKERGKSFGEWDSPISSKIVGEDTVSVGSPTWDGGDLYWLEDRPLEGRQVLVRKSADGETRTVTPAGMAWDVRTSQGAPYTVKGGVVYFSNRADGRVYTQIAMFPADPVPLTPEGGQERYSDFNVDDARERIVCLRRNGKTESAVVAVSLQDNGEEPGPPTVLHTSTSALSSPALSSDGQRLAWVSWDKRAGHSRSAVWVADVAQSGQLSGAKQAAAGAAQPKWSDLGLLYYLSDEQGCWNVFEEGRADPLAPALPKGEEVAARGGSGESPYCVQVDGTILAVMSKSGAASGERLCRIDPLTGAVEQVDSPFVTVRGLAVSEGGICVAGSRRRAARGITLRQQGATEWSDVKVSNENKVRAIYASEPKMVAFEGVGGLSGRALVYPPKNDRYQVELGETPPLIILTSGGEGLTSVGDLELDVWYWTSRGFAVALMPWAFGRKERDALNEASPDRMAQYIQAAAKHLIGSGEAKTGQVVVIGEDAGAVIAAQCLGAASPIAAGACLSGDFEGMSGCKIEKPFAVVHGAKDLGMKQAKSLYEEAKKGGVLCLSAIASREARPFRSAAGKVLALDALLMFVAKALRFEAAVFADYSDEIEIGNYDPLIPGEPRSYIVIDGFELEIGRDSGEVREVGYEDPGDAAYFPEERPDRPSGSDDTDKEETPYMQQIEWL